MKKIIMTISLLTILAGCGNKQFKGFLVCKEYIKGHMDDKKPYVQQEAYLCVRIARPIKHKPKYVPSEWRFYVANKDGVRQFNVDSLTYTRHKVGERIVMNLK